jgi:hypothetical protein
LKSGENKNETENPFDLTCFFYSFLGGNLHVISTVIFEGNGLHGEPNGHQQLLGRGLACP